MAIWGYQRRLPKHSSLKSDRSFSGIPIEYSGSKAERDLPRKTDAMTTAAAARVFLYAELLVLGTEYFTAAEK
jgi:hypothetical protein